MAKKDEFLWLVQSFLNVALLHEIRWPTETVRREDTSLSGNAHLLEEALRAGGRIPEHMSAAEAAHEFFDHMCNLRRKQAGLPESVGDPPWWFGRLI